MWEDQSVNILPDGAFVALFGNHLSAGWENCAKLMIPSSNALDVLPRWKGFAYDPANLPPELNTFRIFKKKSVMPLHEALLTEYKEEAQLTRKMLERVPFTHPDWKPHEKSMTIQRLSSHIAEIPFWIKTALDTDGMDFLQTSARPRFFAKDQSELLQKYDEMFEEACIALSKATDTQLLEGWSVRLGEKLLYTLPKIVVIRKWVFSHTIHHRGQLSVYLRLNDIPVPGMYGPSADEKNK
jgi:uncharacterized damage-inducible protein DinB